MGKGANAQQFKNSGDAQQRSKDLYGNASSESGFLDPTLRAEATNPQGYTPQQLAYMNTASQQSLGGGVAATTGQANLETARTRNAGGFQGAVGTANRSAQRQQSQNALGIQKSQADLQQAQRQQALQSLQSLYGMNLSGSEANLGLSNEALKNENKPSFLQEYLLGAQKAMAGAAASGGAGG